MGRLQTVAWDIKESLLDKVAFNLSPDDRVRVWG